MSVDVDVMPRVVADIQAIEGIKGVSFGARLSVPESPWVWVQFSSFNAPDQSGSDLEATDWVIVARILVRWSGQAEEGETERKALSFIEPIRQAFRQDIKLDQNPEIARVKVSAGAGGWIDINGVWFRYIDLNISAREKRRVVYSVGP